MVPHEKIARVFLQKTLTKLGTEACDTQLSKDHAASIHMAMLAHTNLGFLCSCERHQHLCVRFTSIYSSLQCDSSMWVSPEGFHSRKTIMRYFCFCAILDSDSQSVSLQGQLSNCMCPESSDSRHSSARCILRH